MKLKTNFYDWCIANNKEKYLDWLDKDVDPKEISLTKRINYKFTCIKCGHVFYKTIPNLIASKDLICPLCNSLYIWCIEHNRQDIINAYNTKYNVQNIMDISKGSGIKCYFTLDNDFNGVIMRPAEITGNKNMDPIEKYNDSFGNFLISKFGKENLNKYWSTKNNISPFELYKRSTKSIYMNCQEKEYHGDYETTPDIFYRGCRCPYCASKIIHPLDSFAQFHIDHTDKNFIKKYWCKDNTIDPFSISVYDNDTKIKIQCQSVNYHIYDTTPANFSIGNRCPYCKKRSLKVVPQDSLGALFPEIIPLWSDKNKKSPFDYRVKSHEKIWLKCNMGIHEDFQRIISDYTCNNAIHCPHCTLDRKESFGEELVRKYVESYGYKMFHEYDCTIVPINFLTKMPMPFDNEVVDLKLIIEVHGIQHYQLTGWHISRSKATNKTPEEEFRYQQWKDNYKKQYALSCGYNYIAISYLEIENGTYKSIIDNKIQDLQNTLQKSVETAG